MSVREAVRARLAEWALVAAIVVECVVFAVTAPGFWSVANAVNVMLSIAVTGILAVGMTIVIITAGIDLSVGSVVALAGVTAALAAAQGVWLAALAAFAVGILAGIVDGALIAWAGVPPFIATLAMLTIARGLAFIVSDGRSIGNLPAGFGWVGQTALAGVPVPVILLAVVMVGGAFVLSRTVFGRHVYAVGGNPEAAWLAGIDVRAVTFATYVINGALVGLAGYVLASRLGAGVPNAGLQYELDVIAAVVVGGTSLFGGRGTVGGTLLGTVFIGVLSNGLNLANVDPYIQKIAIGVVILAAVMLGRRAVGADGETVPR